MSKFPSFACLKHDFFTASEGKMIVHMKKKHFIK